MVFGRHEEDIETAIKVVIVGNGGVGKSSMIQRYCKGIFTKEYKKTIGVDFLERQIELNSQDIRLMLWDTAGQEEFDAITKAYYRGAQACVLTFSTVDRYSFEAVESWKNKVEAEVGEITTVIVQNKIDLIDEAEVQTDEAEALAQKLQLRFYRMSVKDNLNVSEVFRYLTDKYLSQTSLIFAEEFLAQKNIASMMPSKKKRSGYRRHDISFSLQPTGRHNYYPDPRSNKEQFTLKCTIL